MMTLITGTPGSGKSLYAVNMLVEKYLKTDRKIYCDIDGLKIEGIEKSPDDWRTTPEGSLIIYDEAQRREVFDGRKRSRAVDDIVLEMDKHRHSGHDIIFITQSPTYLKPQILELIGEHYHVHRPYGAPLASIYFWRNAERKPSGRTAQQYTENKFLFRYDKKLFDYYTSAVEHTHKMRIPPKLIAFMLLPIILAFGVWHFASKSAQVKSMVGVKEDVVATDTKEKSFTQQQAEQIAKFDNKEINTQVSASSTSASIEPIQQATQATPEQLELQRVAMIIDSGYHCRAVNRWGDAIKITQGECKELSKQPFLSASYLNRNSSSNTYDQEQAQPIQSNPEPVKAL